MFFKKLKYAYQIKGVPIHCLCMILLAFQHLRRVHKRKSVDASATLTMHDVCTSLSEILDGAELYAFTSTDTLPTRNQTNEIPIVSDIDDKDLLPIECYLGGFCALAIISCNMFVVILVARSFLRPQLQNVPNFLMLCLAVGDLLTGFLAHPFRLVPCMGFQDAWFGGVFSCYVTQFTSSSLLTFSQYVVVCMSVERYLSLRRPFFYEKHCTLTLFGIVIVMVLIYSVVIAGKFVSFKYYLFSIDNVIVY